MTLRRRFVRRRPAGRAGTVVAGATTALALLVLSVTVAALVLLSVGLGAGAVAVMRERRPRELTRFCAGSLVGLALYVVLAWYGAATGIPAQGTSLG